MILVKDIIGMEIIVGKYEFIAPCHFGLEAVLKKEIIRLGYEIVKVESKLSSDLFLNAHHPISSLEVLHF